MAIDSRGNYIVTESGAHVLSKITPDGVRSVVYRFVKGTWPLGLAIDSQGNYIVTEYSTGVLSRITPSGVRTVIHSFEPGTWPAGVSIDFDGDYVVTELLVNRLSKVTSIGNRIVLHQFSDGTLPSDVLVVPAQESSLAGGIQRLTPFIPYLAVAGLLGMIAVLVLTRKREGTDQHSHSSD